MVFKRPAAKTAKKPASGGFRGSAGLARMREEQDRHEAAREAAKANANQPFRFFVGQGETREIIVVDESPDFFRYEHNLENKRTGRWDLFTACIAEDANCPVCKVAEREPYYAMYLTIIDLTEYENRDGDTVEWSKKLLVIKPSQQKKFVRFFDKHGTLRGAKFSMTRDGQKDASIGNDIEFIEFVEEDELLSYESSFKNKEKKTIEVIGHEPFDYDELFPVRTEKELSALIGGGRRTARDEEDEDTGRKSRRSRDDDDEEEEEDRAWKGKKGASARKPVKRARDEDEEEPEEEEEEEDKPKRPAARKTAATTRKPVRRARDEEEEEEPEEEPEEEEEEAPKRPAARKALTRRPSKTIDEDDDPEAGEEETPKTKAKAAANLKAATRKPTRSRPDPEEEAEEEEEEEEAPKKPVKKGTMAERRAALRRR